MNKQEKTLLYGADFNHEFLWYMNTSEYDFNEILGRADLTIKEYVEVLDKEGRVDKKVLFRLIYGMGLNKKDAESLLDSAGFVPINTTFDNIIFNQLEKECYDKYELELMLREYKCESLFNCDLDHQCELRQFLNENYKYDENYNVDEDELSDDEIVEIHTIDLSKKPSMNLFTITDPNTGKKKTLNEGKTFTQVLFEVLDDLGISNVEAYKRSMIDRKSFSKMLSSNRPSSRLIYLLAFGLELDYDTILKLMHAAGRSFQPGSITDQIAKYYLKNEIYDVFSFDDDLKFNNQKSILYPNE